MGSDFFGAIASIVERGFVAFIFVGSPTRYRPMEQAKGKSKSYWTTQQLPVALSKLKRNCHSSLLGRLLRTLLRL